MMKNYIPELTYKCFNILYSIIHPIVDNSLTLAVIPPEVFINNIFSFLSFKEFQTFGQINKRMNTLTNDPVLLKEVIYKIGIFNPNDWMKHFGHHCKGSVDEVQARKSLPDNIVQIFKGPCPINPDKKLGETHSIFWMPENLSLINFRALLKIKFPEKENGYLGIWDSIFEKYGNDQSKTGEWIMMPINLLSGSCGKSFSIQQKMVEELKIVNFEECSIPSLLEAVIGVSTFFFKYKREMYKDGYTRCQENIDGWQVIAGLYPYSGISAVYQAYPYDNIGIAYCRKLTCKVSKVF